MKIAILGSAPSSLALAPFGDPSWRIWGCSPGVYSHMARCDAWFELHRWEPGIVGKGGTQKPWYSPEYVAWMGMQDARSSPVWMYEAVPQIPASRPLPIDDLVQKYGDYFFTSTIAIMFACAIEDIREARVNGDNSQHEIGLWGVDMAATEEYGYQRAGCQHFALLAADLGIKIVVPPESDLLMPMPIYGICESEHWHIKLTARRRELESRKAGADAAVSRASQESMFLQGALDDVKYIMDTWGGMKSGRGVAVEIRAEDPDVVAHVLERHKPAVIELVTSGYDGKDRRAKPKKARKR